MNISIDELFQTICHWINHKITQMYNKPAPSMVSICPYPGIGKMDIYYDVREVNAIHIRSLAMEALMYFCDRYEIKEPVTICTLHKVDDPDDKYTRWFTWNDGKVTVSANPINYGGAFGTKADTVYTDTDDQYFIPAIATGKSHALKLALNSVYGYEPILIRCNSRFITKIIFSGPCTIVFWSDGDKTMVRRQGNEPDDKEKAVLAAVAKKFLGSNPKKSDYLDKIKPFFEEALKNLEEQNKKEEK